MRIGSKKLLGSAAIHFSLLSVTLFPVVLGCGGSQGAATAERGSATSTSTDRIDRTGSATGSEVDKLAAPKQTVAMFLDCLRRGDEATANSMLTTKARAELQKTAWAMQPLGTPEGKYTIGRAGFPYPGENVVLVECRWQEPLAADQSELAMDIVCELYEEVQGWRIAGMAVTVTGEEEALVIDFEDGAKLQEMLDIANGITPAGDRAQVTQPGVQSGPTTNAGLPPIPEYPAASGSQIALPPNTGNVLR